MPYRPEGWKNPTEEYHNVLDIPTVQDAEWEAYEAGADAILEALIKEHGVKIKKDEWTDDSTFCADSDGIVVSFLIPEEE